MAAFREFQGEFAAEIQRLPGYVLGMLLHDASASRLVGTIIWDSCEAMEQASEHVDRIARLTAVIGGPEAAVQVECLEVLRLDR